MRPNKKNDKPSLKSSLLLPTQIWRVSFALHSIRVETSHSLRPHNFLMDSLIAVLRLPRRFETCQMIFLCSLCFQVSVLNRDCMMVVVAVRVTATRLIRIRWIQVQVAESASSPNLWQQLLASVQTHPEDSNLYLSLLSILILDEQPIQRASRTLYCSKWFRNEEKSV